MVGLLHTLADKTALHLMDLTAAVRDDVDRLKEPADSQALEGELSAGRFLNREFARIVDIVEGWQAFTQNSLREGANRHEARVWAASGSRLAHGFLLLAEVAARLWDYLERSGVAADEVARARDELAAGRERVSAAKQWFVRLEKLTGRAPPDLDPSLIEKGAEEIRQGRFKTGEQILQSIRTPSS